ncbi:MAG TPA: HAMP domain-containing sensor histidine kinase [Puia sp.]|nr:HAMP domain-containing sensor histidine kinase [Puia sp.]
MQLLLPENKTEQPLWWNNKILSDDCAKYISALAHEVRNPLTNINLSVEMLDAGIKDDELKKYLDIIARGSAQINLLVNELLKYQMAENVQAEQHSIHQLLNEVLSSIEDRIMLKNIEVKKNYAAEDHTIFANKAKMKIALTNIIINAIDAISSNDGVLEITTNFNNGERLIEIRDNGVGISEEDLKRIFDPYFTNKIGGMGLGLPTTLDFLLSNHAEIDVQSKEGKGTCVILSFDPLP